MSLLGTVAATVLGNVAGKLFSSGIDAHYQSQQMEKQEELQEKLFEFQNKNKHQFEVEDLRNAGLNPILSATNGSAVGVGGVSMSNFSSDDDIVSSAMQFALQKKQQAIEQQNADSNTKNANTNQALGNSQIGLNMANENLAIQNANSAKAMLKWQELAADADIKNKTLVAGAQAAYYNAAGAAAQLQASSAAAEHYQNIKESVERSLGYEGQRRGQMFKNYGYDLDNTIKLADFDLRMGNRKAASAYDLWRGFTK